MFCKKCGSSVDNNSTYCPYCGEKLKFENDFNTNDNVGGYISISVSYTHLTLPTT